MADYSIPETLDYLLSFKLQDLSLFSYHIYYQSTHTNPYQTHYFQTIITTTNISIITFFQSFTHIIHYPFIKSNITIKHYQSILLIQLHHSATTFISFMRQFGSPITPFHISPFHSFHSTFTFIHISLFYYILLSSLHSYSILLNTITGISFSSFITHIIHFLFPFISTLSYHINSIHISQFMLITFSLTPNHINLLLFH